MPETGRHAPSNACVGHTLVNDEAGGPGTGRHAHTCRHAPSKALARYTIVKTTQADHTPANKLPLRQPVEAPNPAIPGKLNRGGHTIV